MTTEYKLSITKALNGWVVRLMPEYQGLAYGEAMVVTGDEDLGGAIAAMLVSGRLDEANKAMARAPKTPTAVEILATQQNIYANQTLQQRLQNDAMDRMRQFSTQYISGTGVGSSGTIGVSGIANAFKTGDPV